VSNGIHQASGESSSLNIAAGMRIDPDHELLQPVFPWNKPLPGKVPEAVRGNQILYEWRAERQPV
jgi:hypothetical protein